MTLTKKWFVVGGVLILLGGGYFMVNTFWKEIQKESPEPFSEGSSPSDIGEVSLGQTEYSSASPQKTILPIPSGTLGRAISPEASPTTRNRVDLLEKDLAEKAENLDGWLELGVLRKSFKDYEGARLAWEYASAIRPKNSLSFLNLGDLYQFYLHDNIKAEENFKQAIQNDPAFVDGYYRLSELYRLSYTQKIDLASEILKQGIQTNHGNLTLLLQLAEYYRGKKDTMNAKAYYARALEQARKEKNEDAVKEIETTLSSL